MSDVYAIKASTLTALGDAIRDRQGLTSYTEYFYEKPGMVQYRQTSPSITAKNKFIFDVIDMSCQTYDIIKICANNQSGETLLHNNIKKVQFPVVIEAECSAIAFRFEMGETQSSFMECNITTIPLDDDGNEYKYTPLQMVEEINALAPTPTNEELTLTGDCNQRFIYGGWDWFIKKYSDVLTTKDLTDTTQMFFQCQTLTNIPFDLNYKANTNVNITGTIGRCGALLEVPKMNNVRVENRSELFSYCSRIKEIPDDFCDTWDWTYMDGLTSGYSGNSSSMFRNCYNLKKFPMSLFEHGNPVAVASYTVWKETFSNCLRLEEVIGMPNPHYNTSYTSSGYNGLFSSMLSKCGRLTRFTFAEMDPPTWSNQTIDFSDYVGWSNFNLATSYYGGTEDEANYKITDDATYQALKDHPDSWTTDVAYSRYNHDSAVETINSLPDTSTTGSANVIKFKGEAGSKTDGGAINTLTEEEIAVATAKGWTVTLA